MIDYRKTDDGVMELRVSGKITSEEMESISARIRMDMPEHGKVRMLEFVEDFDGIELSALWYDLHRNLPLTDRFERVAVISDRRWIDMFSGVADRLVSCDVRHFEPGAIGEARSWLREPSRNG
ncbi:MAG: STAS/SEC14 domain-containing protein [Fulvimarina manganoxydans]|uniref:STAS/SEC14 domain-containing protein n=1 Tax=Fulvimarina manganoxydans TaxID=937218 RepID=UPI002357244A|nr:STAS/SEC14 domain-containing protein [Fulvimarina manganoxydans]MCK5931016.1 STAS/SEC14 domain-containing protein [Fulvimarina manganoxydans]